MLKYLFLKLFVLLALGEGCRRGGEAQVEEPVVPSVCRHQLPVTPVVSGITSVTVSCVRGWEFGAGRCWKWNTLADGAPAVLLWPGDGAV